MKIYIINLPKGEERKVFEIKQIEMPHIDYKITTVISVANLSRSILRNITLTGKDHLVT